MTYVTAEDLEQLHGMFWPNEYNEVGTVTARVTVENASGLSASSETAVELDALYLNNALFTETVLDMPSELGAALDARLGA